MESPLDPTISEHADLFFFSPIFLIPVFISQKIFLDLFTYNAN